jgi:hypothetical protein
MSFVFNKSFWYIYIKWFLCPLQVKRPTKYYFQYFYFFAILTNNCMTLLIIDISEIVKQIHKKQFEGYMTKNAIITLWKSSFINVKPSPSLWIAPSVNIIFINKINMTGWYVVSYDFMDTPHFLYVLQKCILSQKFLIQDYLT